MATTTLPPAEPLEEIRSALTRRLINVRPYIAVGQIYVFIAFVVTWGAVQNIYDIDTQLYFPIGLMGASIALFAPRDAVRHTFVSLPLLLLMTYLICSIAWVTGVIPFRVVALSNLPIVVGTVFVASILPFERILVTLKAAFLFGIVLSIYACLTMYKAQVHLDFDGTLALTGWRGSFLHKNGLVPFLVFACITFAIFERRRWLRVFVYASTVVLTIGSQSSTGLSCVIVLLCAAWWLRSYMRQDLRMSGAYLALSFLGAIGVALSITVALPYIVNLYGKDVTLSNRTVIWDASANVIAERPIFGYGWNGVWLEPNVEPTATLVRDIGFSAGHSHNSAIEMLLQGGIIGLTLYLAFFFSVFSALGRALRTHPDIARWGILILVTQMIVGVSEVTLFYGWLFILVLIRGILARESSNTARAPV